VAVQILRHMIDSARSLSLRGWLMLTLAAGGVVFLTDLFVPSGVSVAVLYALVVLLALGAPDPRAVVGAACISTVLAWVDAIVAHRRAADPLWLVNICVVLAVIWVATLIVHRYMAAARATMERSFKELEDLKWAIDQSAIVATTDTRGVIKYANEKFCEISKYSRDELIGRDHRIINSGYHPKPFIRDLWHTIASGRIWKGELKNRAKDGATYWVDTTIVPFLDEYGQPYQYMAIRYDITERKRSEDLLREQAALARLGEMAAVVAHEVKNPLAGIRGALQVISTRMPAQSRDRSVIGDILARLDSLNEMVHDLLLFARPRAPRIASVIVGPLVEATALLLKRDPVFALVDVGVHDGQQTVDADSELLQIVFSNLLLNAAQAMNGEGRVDVTVARQNGRCEIAFRDTGPGMPPEVRERMFEPFFTTKHRGTGLGLSTARRVVEQHHGEIRAECPPEGGTVVIVALPASRPPEGSPAAAAVVPLPSARQGMPE
jgi:PAS domain S-box-containing protein